MERYLVITGLLSLGLLFLAPLAAGIHNADPTTTLEGYQAQVDPAVVGPETVDQGFHVTVSWDENSTLGAEMRITDVFIYPPSDLDLSEDNGGFNAVGSGWVAESSSDRAHFYRSTGSGAEKVDTNPPNWTFQVAVQDPDSSPPNDGKSLTWRADPCHSPIRGSGIFVCGSGVHLGNAEPSRDEAALEATNTWDESPPEVTSLEVNDGDAPVDGSVVGGDEVQIVWETGNEDHPDEVDLEYRPLDDPPAEGSWETIKEGIKYEGTSEGTGGTYDWDVTELEGDYEVRAVATDEAENTGDHKESSTFTIDNMPPSLTVLQPTPVGPHSGDVTVEWETTDAHPANTVNVDYAVAPGEGKEPQWTNDPKGCEGDQLASGSCPWKTGVDLSDKENSYLLRLTAWDKAGNQGERALDGSERFMVDNRDPVVTGLIIDNDGDGSSDELAGSNIMVAWETEDANPGTVSLKYASAKEDEPTWLAVEGCQDVWDTTGGQVCPWDTTTVEGDGEHQVRATATDSAGNTGEQETSALFVLDNMAPTVQSVDLQGDAPYSGSATIVWETDEVHPGTVSIEYQNGTGTKWHTVTDEPIQDGEDGEPGGTYEWDTSDPDGVSDDSTWLDGDEVRVRVMATDEAGNTGEPGMSDPFEVDNTPASLKVVEPDADVLNGTVTLNWTLNDNYEGIATLAVNNSTGEQYEWITIADEIADATNFTWDTTDPLGDGTVPSLHGDDILLVLNVTNDANNNASVDKTFTVNNEPPDITFETPAADGGTTFTSKDVNVSVNITGLTTTTAHCKLNEGDLVPCNDQANGSFLIDDVEHWANEANHTFTNVPEGEHELTVKADVAHGPNADETVDFTVAYEDVASIDIVDEANESVTSDGWTWSTNVDDQDELKLYAAGYDEEDNWLGNVTATWGIDGFENTDAPDGEAAFLTFVGDEVGEGHITADHEDVEASPAATTGTITVEKGALDHIELTPDEETLQVDESLTLTASGEDHQGNAKALDDADWSATCGSIQSAGDTGDASTDEATFTAPETPGECDITVEKNNDDGDAITATATITIMPGDPDDIVLSCPERATVASQAGCQAHAEDAHGNELPEVGIEFSAHDDRDESLTIEDGILTMPTKTAHGPVTVEAANASASIAATSTIIVQAGPLDSVTIQHATIGRTITDETLAPGDTLELAAAGQDAHGNPLGNLEEASWSMDGDTNAFALSGTTGATTTLEALEPGEATVHVDPADADIDTASTGTLTAQEAQPDDEDEASLAIPGLRSPSHPEDQWVDDRDVQLAWDPPAGDAADKIAAYAYALVPEEDGGEPVAATVDASTSEVTASAPADGRYDAHVQSQTQEGRSGPVATYGPVLVDTQPPAPVDSLVAEAMGDGTVELSWEQASDETSGVAGYHVSRTTGQALEDAARVTSTPIDGTTFTDDADLEAGQTYRYLVAAVDHAGLDGSPSDPAQVRIDGESGDNDLGEEETAGQTTVQPSDETAKLLAEFLQAPDDLDLVALDTSGDGQVDTLDEERTDVRVDRTSTIEDQVALLLSLPEEPPRAVWVPAVDEAYPLHLVTAKGEANITETDGRIQATFTIDEPAPWALIELPDEQTDARLTGVETSQGPIPDERVWREDGSVLVLDDGDATYHVVYETQDGVPGPSVGVLVAVLAGSALALVRRGGRS